MFAGSLYQMLTTFDDVPIQDETLYPGEPRPFSPHPEDVPRRRRNHREVPDELIDDRMISADQWAATCGVTKRQVFRWQDSGYIPEPDLNIGQIRRWSIATFRAWLNSHQIRRQHRAG